MPTYTTRQNGSDVRRLEKKSRPTRRVPSQERSRKRALRILDAAARIFADGAQMNREFARRIETVLAAKARALPKARRAVVASMIVEVVTAMLFYAVRKDAAAGEAVIAETKRMLVRYLRPYAEGGDA